MLRPGYDSAGTGFSGWSFSAGFTNEMGRGFGAERVGKKGIRALFS